MPLFPKHWPKPGPAVEPSAAVKALGEATKAKMDPKAIVISANGEPIRYRKWDSDTGKYFSMSVASGKYSEADVIADLDARIAEWKKKTPIDTEQADEVVVKPGLYFDDEKQRIVRIGADGKPVQENAATSRPVMIKSYDDATFPDDGGFFKKLMNRFKGSFEVEGDSPLGMGPYKWEETGGLKAEYSPNSKESVVRPRGGGKLSELITLMNEYPSGNKFLDQALEFVQKNRKRFLDDTKFVIAPGYIPGEKAYSGILNTNLTQNNIPQFIHIPEEVVRKGNFTAVHRVLLHEIFHAGTTKDIFTKEASYKEWRYLYENAKEKMLLNPMKVLGDDRLYGWTNEHEFVAEASTNSQFRELLQTLPFGKGSVYDQFMLQASKYFGIAGAAVLAPEVIEEMEQVFRVKENTNGA